MSVFPGLTVALFIVLGAVVASAEKPKQLKTGTHAKPSIKQSIERTMYFAPDDLKWVDASPGLPPGTKVVLLDGDPAIPDRLFTMRMKLPVGARLPPHFHPSDEHVTVISGELRSGVGEKFDADAMRVMPAGSYYALPGGQYHYAEATKDTVIQMHGVGPWELVNPADASRHPAKQASAH